MVVLQAELPTHIGVVEGVDTAMETDDKSIQSERNYFLDTNSIKVPRKGMEINTFLKDGMSNFVFQKHFLKLKS